jgi:hypothetical protein
VAGLLRQYVADYVAQHPGQAAPQVQSTLAKLSLCRTAALGGRRYRCGACESECTVYNSCGDRHCPQCSGAKRSDWLASTAGLLLPGIDYFQVVFTIPDKLSALTLGNRRALYDLLFAAAWQSLREVIDEEQGFEAAAAMVLHTWNQQLEPHVHVHAVVPGGGPSLRGARRWITSHRRDVPRSVAPYLVNADELRRRFRETFLTGLRRLHRQGALKLEGEWSFLHSTVEFEAWLQPMEQVNWVTYIQPPPGRDAAPEHVLKYLARYLTGGPISDRRLISNTQGDVTFWARTGSAPGGDRTDRQPCKLPGREFVRRWSLHILPKGFVKTRRFGGYSNRQSQRYRAASADLLPASGGQPATVEPGRKLQDRAALRDAEPIKAEECPAAEPTEPSCPRCGERMQCRAARDRDGWFLVMHSLHRPRWYLDGS